MRLPELMSPAGHWTELQTAIEAGADAVYFGLDHFSARAKVGFTSDELPEVMKALHRRSVKGFITFNTLVFDDELLQAEKAIRAIAAAGVDAVIVQDVGMVKLIRLIAPDLAIHGSTQMSITSAEGAELAASLGCNRVVLGRELSLADIRKIAAGTQVELEVFVHGALCVSYSGQCFSSEAWGGRSANRGQCAQACRLSYDLIVDGQQRELGAYRYLLSPGDLCALEHIAELAEIGVHCLKIEGRYKDSNYVAATTRAYRRTLDCIADSEVTSNLTSADPTDETGQELEQVYSRGLGPHFISGTNHQTVVIGRAPRHRGVRLGVVTAVSIDHVDVVLDAGKNVNAGDGVVFDAADWRSPDLPEEGGNVYEVNRHADLMGSQVELKFGRAEIDFSRIRIGDWVWRTRDPQLNKRLKPMINSESPRHTRPIDFEVFAVAGEPLEIRARLTGDSTSANYVGARPLSKAEKQPLDLSRLTEQLGRLGGTPFQLGKIRFDSTDSLFVPISLLNDARRQLVNQLLQQASEIHPIPSRPVVARVLKRADQLAQSSASTTAFAEGNLPLENGVPDHDLDLLLLSLDTIKRRQKDRPLRPQLHVLVRNAEQLDAVLAISRSLEVASVTLDYLELYGLRPSVEKIQAAGLRARVASPRILKPSEQNVVRFLHSLRCDLLIRTAGLIAPQGGLRMLRAEFEQDSSAIEKPQAMQVDQTGAAIELIGDFSLNAANAITCHAFLKLGLNRITPTYDLNSKQIEVLTRRVPAHSLEAIVYSHLPVFHTEHCVFCRFLSKGTDHTNCGHPCEKHRLAIRDHNGRAHPVMADVGCRNTVFGAQAQTDPRSIESWLKAGIQHFRVEFVHQNSVQVAGIVQALGGFLQGELDRRELECRLIEHSPQQTTLGSLFVPVTKNPI